MNKKLVLSKAQKIGATIASVATGVFAVAFTTFAQYVADPELASSTEATLGQGKANAMYFLLYAIPIVLLVTFAFWGFHKGRRWIFGSAK